MLRHADYSAAHRAARGRIDRARRNPVGVTRHALEHRPDRVAAAVGAPEEGRHRRRGDGRPGRGLRARCAPGTSRSCSRRGRGSAGASTRCASRSRDGLYAEAGAMRIPRTHDLTMAYCRAIRAADSSPFTVSNPNAYFHLGGRRFRMREVRRRPRVPRVRRGATASADGRWTALGEGARALRAGVERERGRGLGRDIAGSTTSTPRASSSSTCGWSEGAIELFGLLESRRR